MGPPSPASLSQNPIEVSRASNGAWGGPQPGHPQNCLGEQPEEGAINPLLLTISMAQLFQAITSKGNVVLSAAVERIRISPQNAAELQLDIQPLGACGCRQKTSEFPPRALQSDGINNNDKKEENTEKIQLEKKSKAKQNKLTYFTCPYVHEGKISLLLPFSLPQSTTVSADPETQSSSDPTGGETGLKPAFGTE
ncbi:hypothetical protein Anapl_16979 [Anas platyrhynchos]|uniref:Uncharacterized protein n=1 Tax=Anas platyrhynchos TaxID=8839 RepID=R0KTS2_ANAPL|nr:hypothetical protein Anapl_16979 [Anas platyrhynchos]